MLKTLFFSLFILFHPVHVTLTSIDYSPESDSFRVFVKLYMDDLLKDYELSGNEISKSVFSGDSTSLYKIVDKYIGDKIQIFVNDRLLTGRLKNLRMEDNEISINLTYDSGRRIKTLKVKNLIMTNLYKDQSNMMIVRINNFEEGVKLTSELTEKTFKVN